MNAAISVSLVDEPQDLSGGLRAREGESGGVTWIADVKTLVKVKDLIADAAKAFLFVVLRYLESSASFLT